MKKEMKTNSVFAAIAVACLLILSGFTKYNTFSNTQGIGFVKNSTWKTVVAEAQKENKPIFVDISTSWCGPCKRLKWFTFIDKNVAAFYNQNFINVAMDGETGEGAQMVADLGLKAYPSLCFFDKNGKLLLYAAGFMKPDELIEAGNAALKKLSAD